MEEVSHLSKVRAVLRQLCAPCLCRGSRHQASDGARRSLLQTDLLNVWKLVHMYNIDRDERGKRRTFKQQLEYLASVPEVRLTRDQYESMIGLQQNRYRCPRTPLPHPPHPVGAPTVFALTTGALGAGTSLGAYSTVRDMPWLRAALRPPLARANCKLVCSVPDAVDGQCQLSFDELSDLFSVFSKVCEPEEKARVAFCMYDLDRDCKLDKTDIGNVVLRFVFDMPPLLDKTWAKVEPRMKVTDYTEEELTEFKGMVKEIADGLRGTTTDPVTGEPYELDQVQGLLIAAEVNGYVEECLDEASHDVYQPGQEDTRAIHWPEFKKALERNPEFDANFTLPITLPIISRKQVADSRHTFNVAQDLPGTDGDLTGDGWIHPMRPTLLQDRIRSYAKISAAKKKQKKKKGDDDEEAEDAKDYSSYAHKEGLWNDFKHWIQVKKEVLEQQDPNPLWRRSLLTMEGSFGAGVGSVFRLYRWFFVMNLYIAGTWGLFVMFPVLAVEYLGMQVPTDDVITQINPFNAT
eukprot:COSAG02_NODE_8368_length_2596_cov_11.117741_1_plen_519_part_10